MTEESEANRNQAGSAHIEAHLRVDRVSPGAQVSAIRAQRIENLHVHGLLGDLPLGLHLAGCYMNEVKALPVPEYLRELRVEGALGHESQAE